MRPQRGQAPDAANHGTSHIRSVGRAKNWAVRSADRTIGGSDRRPLLRSVLPREILLRRMRPCCRKGIAMTGKTCDAGLLWAALLGLMLNGCLSLNSDESGATLKVA